MSEEKKLPLLLGKYTEVDLGWRLAAFLFSPALLVFFIPDFVVSRYVEANDLVDFVSGYVPAINRMDNIGLMVEANKLIYSLVWVCSLFVSPLIAYSVYWRFKNIHVDVSAGKMVFFFLVGIFAIWHCYTLYIYSGGDTQSAILQVMFGSKIGIFLSAPIHVHSFWVALFGSLATLIKLIILESKSNKS